MMLVDVIIPLVFLLNFQISNSNYFEGFVTYTHEYSIDSLSHFYGDSSVYFFKEGNYKQVFNGEKVKLSLYDVDSNKIISIVNSDTIVTDCSKKSEDILGYEVTEDAETVFGKPCDLLVLRTNRRTVYYFYNDDLSIDPIRMSGHEYSSLSFIYSKTSALPLKIVNRYANFSVTMTAVDVRKTSLEEGIFDLK
ncbi:MAG: hypothetical protein AAF705_20500 [Bacteroidota bacterium]